MVAVCAPRCWPGPCCCSLKVMLLTKSVADDGLNPCVGWSGRALLHVLHRWTVDVVRRVTSPVLQSGMQLWIAKTGVVWLPCQLLIAIDDGAGTLVLVVVTCQAAYEMQTPSEMKASPAAGKCHSQANCPLANHGAVQPDFVA